MLLLFWVSSGKGGWIFGSLILVLAVMMGLDHYLLPPGDRVWPVAVGLALSGAFSLALGLHARFSPPRLILERQTGREIMRRPIHSMYWIRAEYWGILFLGLGLLLTLGPARRPL
jgi:hypothetical protein